MTVHALGRLKKWRRKAEKMSLYTQKADIKIYRLVNHVDLIYI